MENLKLNVTREEAELVIGALQELPFKMTHQVIDKLVKQCNGQLEQSKEIPQMEGTSDALEAL